MSGSGRSTPTIVVLGTLDTKGEEHCYLASLIRHIGAEVLVLAHGGPIATSTDWKYVRDHTEGLNGFLGASSMERLPVEQGIAAAVAEFKGS